LRHTLQVDDACEVISVALPGRSNVLTALHCLIMKGRHYLCLFHSKRRRGPVNSQHPRRAGKANQDHLKNWNPRWSQKVS